MKVSTYHTMLDEDKKNILVRESEIEYGGERVDTPQKVVELLNTVYGVQMLAEEHMYVIAMTMKSRPAGIFEVSHGTVDCTLIQPREVFIRLLLAGAGCFVIAHNHPAGDPMPSNEDIEVTERIKKCADLLGIRLLDHVIAGDETYFSFMENNLL